MKPVHVLPLLLQAFHADMLQATVGSLAEQIIDKVERDVIKDRLGIQMSMKPGANRPF